MEKFRAILGKIPRNFSILTPQIFCFTGDGSSEELTWEKFRHILEKNPREKSNKMSELFHGKNSEYVPR
jgi:hypothetical protein